MVLIGHLSFWEHLEKPSLNKHGGLRFQLSHAWNQSLINIPCQLTLDQSTTQINTSSSLQLPSANGHCTASQYSAIPKHSRTLLTQTNQKFHHKFSVFECMKIAQNYTQVSLPSPHSI